MKRSNFVIATLLALFSVFAAAYMSCNKTTDGVMCTGTTCNNGGVCSLDSNRKPKCTCPTGFEGTTCQTKSVDKFIGTWNLRQVITGSDSTAYNHDTSYYQVTLARAYTPTTFFIDNFFNDQQYNNIICTLAPDNSYNFMIDTISAYFMVYNHFIIQGGYGNYNHDTINALLYIQFKNKTTNWQIDTINFKMWQ